MRLPVRLSPAAALVIPFLLALAVHARSVGFDFMSDDGKLVLDNPQVTSAGPLRALLATDWSTPGTAARLVTGDPS